MAVIAAIVAALAGPRLTATAQHTFTAHSAPLREVAFSPDGYRHPVGGADVNRPLTGV